MTESSGGKMAENMTETPQSTQAEEVDPILAAVAESESGVIPGTTDAETVPSGGAVETGGLWAAPKVESHIANHTTDSEDGSDKEGALAAPTTAEKVIQPIAPEAPETPVMPAAPVVPSSVAPVTMPPIMTPNTEVPVFDAEIPSTLPDMTKINQEFTANLEATQDQFESKIESFKETLPESNPAPAVEDAKPGVDQISDPEERLEARKESAKEVFAKMKEDLSSINESFDRQLIEAQATFEEKMNQAKNLKSEAKDLKLQGESKDIEAYNLETMAQNDLEKVQGLVSGKKAEVAQKLERLESLQV